MPYQPKRSNDNTTKIVYAPPDHSFLDDIIIHSSLSTSQTSHSLHHVSHTSLPSHSSEQPIKHESLHLSESQYQHHSDNPIPLKRSNRVHQKPAYLQDYHCNLVNKIQSSTGIPDASSSAQCKYHISSFMSYHNLSSAHKHSTLNISPLSYMRKQCLMRIEE